MVARLLFLMAVLCQSRGQVFYDTGNAIMRDSSVFYDVSSSNRLICNDGTDTYFTEGDEIRRRTGTTTSDPFIDTNGGAIESLSCACNIIVYTYRIGVTIYLVFRSSENSVIIIHVDITAMGRTSVSVERETRTVAVVSRTAFKVYQLNFNAALVAEGTFPTATPLPIEPRCIAAYRNGDDWHIFVSFDWSRDVREVFYDNSGPTVTVNVREVKRAGNNLNARVACLDICGSTIYFLHERSGGGWEITSYSVSDWASPNDGVPYSSTAVQETGNIPSSISNDVNGLDVYNSACDLDCNDDACDCDTNQNPNCGFCVDTESTCQCESSSTDNCVYEDSGLANQCTSFTPTIDALCAVRNPLAQRRKTTGGDVIDVVGVSRVSSTITVDKRTARTGRWSTLPPNVPYGPISGPPVWYNGFSAVIQSQARGQRFGVFEAEIDPVGSDQNTERINCIVTENSGFYNKLYTYTGVVGGGAVTLEAMVNTHVNMFVPSMRWRFQRIDQDTNMPDGSIMPLSLCTGSTTCSVPTNGNTLSKTDEGIYEVYRPRRDLRSWHPIFFLYVRECGRNQFGIDCSSSCNPACVYGTCDRSGTCVCYPGWSGNNCATVCGDGRVGQDCQIRCSDIFPGNTNCWDILFCQPNKMGCTCSTGRKPPDCADECDMGFWGPNCQETCTPPCDPRTGQ